MDDLQPPKAIEIRRNKWDLIKLTSFYTAKEMINKMKRYLQDGRKYLQIIQLIGINLQNIQAAHTTMTTNPIKK